MTSDSIHSLLLRGILDKEFYEQLIADPQMAIAEYDLTSHERALIAQPSREFYALLRPSTQADESEQSGRQISARFEPPTIIAVVIVASIVASVVAPTSPLFRGPLTSADAATLAALRRATGAERYGHIRAYVKALSQGARG